MDGLEFTQTIEKKLKALGIKKTDFYKECGISSASFSQWRTGKHVPEYSTLQRINAFLGTSFGFAKEETPAPVEEGEREISPELMKTARQKVLREMFEKLSEDEQYDVIFELLARKQMKRDQDRHQ